MRQLLYPFVFRTTGTAIGPPPARSAGFTTSVLDQGTEASISVIPQEPGVSVSFVLPAGLVPARSNLPGRSVGGRWIATFARYATGGHQLARQLRQASAPRPGHNPSDRVAGLGHGWPPRRWLPQERAVWTGGGTWVLPMPPPLAATVAVTLRLRNGYVYRRNGQPMPTPSSTAKSSPLRRSSIARPSSTG